MTQSPTFVFSVPGEERGERRQYSFTKPSAQWQVRFLADMPAAFERAAQIAAAGKFVALAISYEAAAGFESALSTHSAGRTPLAWFAAFDRAGEFCGSHGEFSLGKPEVQGDRHEYVTRIRTLLQHITLGDIYQANFTIRALCPFGGDAYAAFCALNEAVPMPYAAYADLGAEKIVSLSPELFLERKGNLLRSKPMKGTAPRKPSWDDDEAARLALHFSAKDRAENTMIVDLMRSDFGRICQTGSVKTCDEYSVERFPTVHQMTTTVEGKLREGISLYDIFRATFPAGSITGAPKVRASEIIRETESRPRGIYCGAIGLLFPGEDFVFNVAIRTLEINGNIAELGIGSGIVADSDPEREWDEVLLKASFVERRPEKFGLYEAFRYVPGVGYQNLDDHLRRLEHSCIYFGRPFPRDRILCKLEQVKGDLGDKPNRIRLDLDGHDISIRLMPEELSWSSGGVSVMIPDHRIDPADFRLYHKTTLRADKYALRERARAMGAEECLLVNTRGEFTEGTISSFIFRIHGEWIAPELSCGLLPGVWRDHQVNAGRARAGVVRLAQLDEIEDIRIGNSVRGEERVTRVFLEDGTEVYRERAAAE